MTRLGEAALEDKLDGARIQVHRDGDEVRVYTRGLIDFTAEAPAIVEVARGLAAKRLILDGECLAIGERGGPLPFQETMTRGRPLVPFFFDVLLVTTRSSWISRSASGTRCWRSWCQCSTGSPA